ncbi:MAG TPA: polyprenyl synthetase family protein, partial [Acidimicrobiales bacterium]|nr:polyprenyl synthetase family protein [Acidimicrobiales bacterium]
SPELRRPAEYHLGWVDVDGRPAAGSGGKHVRAALALLSAAAVGADETVGVPGAVAIELVHNFSLLHDDVIDVDRERRHRTTVWAAFGVGPAITAGDALHTLAIQVLLDEGTPEAVRAVAALADGTSRMIAGETVDIVFETRDDVTWDECLEMSSAKTGALLACAASLGAILAGAPAQRVEALAAYGLHLGLAFQAVDDVLGIWGETATTGKPVFGDLRQQKKTLPITAALASSNGNLDELRALLEASRDDEVAAGRAAELIDKLGGRQATEAAAVEHLNAALAALHTARPVPAVEAELAELARYVVERQQ